MNKIIVYIGILLLSLCAWGAEEVSETTQSPAPMTLKIVEQTIEVDDKLIKTYNIIQPDGNWGLAGNKGQWFDAVIQNKTDQPTALHWQGVIVPNDQDGTPFVTQTTIPPGGEYHAKFRLFQGGTFLLRSAYKTQLQNLMAIPFIVYESKDSRMQNVVMFLQDYSFNDPKESYPEQRRKLLQKIANIQLTPAENKQQQEQVTMDAYLTNRRTLANPEIVRITPDSQVYLRVINAAANSNFYLDLGELTGRLVAVDSEPVMPISGTKFQIAQGQRLDILLNMPPGEHYYPILAQAEDTTQLTGMILATPTITPPLINPQSSLLPASLDYSQELALQARYPLISHLPNQSYNLDLIGNMLSYTWTMNDQIWPKVTPLLVNYGDRVAITLQNKSGIPIPIHLHGHLFQVIAIDGERINGAMRDTVLVLPHSSVTIAFDADNPGIWLLEGVIPFQNYGRMATTINYQDYPVPIFKGKDTGIPFSDSKTFCKDCKPLPPTYTVKNLNYN